MKKVLLSGASGDIGASIFKKFQQEDYILTAPSREELDLSNISAIEDYFAHASKEYDIFIHCAGVNVPSLIENQSVEQVSSIFTVNTLSFYTILQLLIPHLKNNGGRVLAISSLYGSIAREGRSAYVMSKHALNGLVKTSAIELGKYAVLVNTLSPGFVDTQMTRKNNTPETIRSFEKKIPLSSLAQTTDIADVAYFLCSPLNTYITGQDIIVDGGFMAGGFQS